MRCRAMYDRPTDRAARSFSTNDDNDGEHRAPPQLPEDHYMYYERGSGRRTDDDARIRIR